MYTLTSEALEVSILDPVADQERFGTRYCTGGYIFQIEDRRHGALLSGPTYPDSFNWFDGQGIPDAFNLSPLREPDAPEADALIVGIGVCDLRDNQVREFCRWDIEQRPAALAMRTAQAFQGFALELQRTVAIHDRTVRSTTHVRNTGRLPIPIRWFPHPFFPHPATNELCRLNIPVSIPAEASYELAESGFIARKDRSWLDGQFLALDHAAQTSVAILQRHPLLGLIAATCSYIPSYFPIWGNPLTFSWEPFLERTIGASQELSWWIDYDF
jgi:hypothetical protein